MITINNIQRYKPFSAKTVYQVYTSLTARSVETMYFLSEKIHPMNNVKRQRRGSGISNNHGDSANFSRDVQKLKTRPLNKLFVRQKITRFRSNLFQMEFSRLINY